MFLRVDVDGAMVDYSRAIQLDAQYAEAYSNRANAFHDKADYYRALSDFDRALQLNPRYAPAYFGRGYAKAAVGRTLDAITDFTKVVRIESRNAKAFVNRAILRFLRGDLSGAADDCRRAISIRPDTEAFYVRGRIRQNQGLLDEAIEDYSRAITADQNNAMAFAHLGFALLAKGRTDDAQRNFNRVTQIDPRLGREIDPRMISEALALTKSSIRSPIPKPASK